MGVWVCGCGVGVGVVWCGYIYVTVLHAGWC